MGNDQFSSKKLSSNFGSSCCQEEEEDDTDSVGQVAANLMKNDKQNESKGEDNDGKGSQPGVPPDAPHGKTGKGVGAALSLNLEKDFDINEPEPPAMESPNKDVLIGPSESTPGSEVPKVLIPPEEKPPTIIQNPVKTAPSSSCLYDIHLRIAAGRSQATEKERSVIFDRYRVVSKLGAGGFGSVLKVFDINTLSVLTMKKRLATRDVKKMRQVFLDESFLWSTIPPHQNVCEFKYLRFDENGDCYLFMEYLRGITLEDFIHSKRVGKKLKSGFYEGTLYSGSPSEILKLALGGSLALLHGLKHIHDHSVGHQDLKPGNIMVCSNSSSEKQWKILDFGISKTNNQLGVKKLIWLEYDAPEHRTGNSSMKSDIYSWAIIVLEIFGYDTTSTTELCREEELEDTAEKIPEIPENLRRFVLACLLPNPEKRPELSTLISAFKEELDGLENNTSEVFGLLAMMLGLPPELAMSRKGKKQERDDPEAHARSPESLCNMGISFLQSADNLTKADTKRFFERGSEFLKKAVEMSAVHPTIRFNYLLYCAKFESLPLRGTIELYQICVELAEGSRNENNVVHENRWLAYYCYALLCLQFKDLRDKGISYLEKAFLFLPKTEVYAKGSLRNLIRLVNNDSVYIPPLSFMFARYGMDMNYGNVLKLKKSICDTLYETAPGDVFTQAKLLHTYRQLFPFSYFNNDLIKTIEVKMTVNQSRWFQKDRANDVFYALLEFILPHPTPLKPFASDLRLFQLGPKVHEDELRAYRSRWCVYVEEDTPNVCHVAVLCSSNSNPSITQKCEISLKRDEIIGHVAITIEPKGKFVVIIFEKKKSERIGIWKICPNKQDDDEEEESILARLVGATYTTKQVSSCEKLWQMKKVKRLTVHNNNRIVLTTDDALHVYQIREGGFEKMTEFSPKGGKVCDVTEYLEDPSESGPFLPKEPVRRMGIQMMRMSDKKVEATKCDKVVVLGDQSIEIFDVNNFKVVYEKELENKLGDDCCALTSRNGCLAVLLKDGRVLIYQKDYGYILKNFAKSVGMDVFSFVEGLKERDGKDPFMLKFCRVLHIPGGDWEKSDGFIAERCSLSLSQNSRFLICSTGRVVSIWSLIDGRRIKSFKREGDGSSAGGEGDRILSFFSNESILEISNKSSSSLRFYFCGWRYQKRYNLHFYDKGVTETTYRSFHVQDVRQSVAIFDDKFVAAISKRDNDDNNWEIRLFDMGSKELTRARPFTFELNCCAYCENFPQMGQDMSADNSVVLGTHTTTPLMFCPRHGSRDERGVPVGQFVELTLEGNDQKDDKVIQIKCFFTRCITLHASGKVRIWNLNPHLLNCEKIINKLSDNNGVLPTSIAVTWNAFAVSVGATIKVFDFHTLENVVDLEGHTDVVTCIDFPKIDFCTLMASCARDYSIRLWDWKGGILLKRIGLDYLPKQLVFNKRGQFFATIGSDCCVRVYSSISATLQHEFWKLESPPCDIAWCINSIALLCCCKDEIHVFYLGDLLRDSIISTERKAINSSYDDDLSFPSEAEKAKIGIMEKVDLARQQKILKAVAHRKESVGQQIAAKVRQMGENAGALRLTDGRVVTPKQLFEIHMKNCVNQVTGNHEDEELFARYESECLSEESKQRNLIDKYLREIDGFVERGKYLLALEKLKNVLAIVEDHVSVFHLSHKCNCLCRMVEIHVMRKETEKAHQTFKEIWNIIDTNSEIPFPIDTLVKVLYAQCELVQVSTHLFREEEERLKLLVSILDKAIELVENEGKSFYFELYAECVLKKCVFQRDVQTMIQLLKEVENTPFTQLSEMKLLKQIFKLTSDIPIVERMLFLDFYLNSPIFDLSTAGNDTITRHSDLHKLPEILGYYRKKFENVIMQQCSDKIETFQVLMQRNQSLTCLILKMKNVKGKREAFGVAQRLRNIGSAIIPRCFELNVITLDAQATEFNKVNVDALHSRQNAMWEMMRKQAEMERKKELNLHLGMFFENRAELLADISKEKGQPCIFVEYRGLKGGVKEGEKLLTHLSCFNFDESGKVVCKRKLRYGVFRFNGGVEIIVSGWFMTLDLCVEMEDIVSRSGGKIKKFVKHRYTEAQLVHRFKDNEVKPAVYVKTEKKGKTKFERTITYRAPNRKSAEAFLAKLKFVMTKDHPYIQSLRMDWEIRAILGNTDTSTTYIVETPEGSYGRNVLSGIFRCVTEHRARDGDGEFFK